MLALMRWCSRIPLDFPEPGKSTTAGFYGDFRSFRWGGSEEAIVAKGSPWPQELARVLAALLQTAGVPSRLVFLYRESPSLLHTVVEAWVNGGWAVCDACANRCYIWPHRGYASARDLQRQPRLVDQAPEHGRNPCVDSSLFGTIAVSPYHLAAVPAPMTDLQPAVAGDRARLRAATQVFQQP
jgi:Transglutaminase-like superfamily